MARDTRFVAFVAVHETTGVPGSALPDDQRWLGYDVVTAGDGERVLPRQIMERFSRRADGELEPFAEGSSKSVSVVVTNARIAVVVHDLRQP